MMYVVGATQGQMFEDIRKVAPNHFLLVPGVGAQGGSLQEVCKYGIIKDCGLLVNSSRGIIYASNGEDFAEVAGQKAKELQEEMAAEACQAGLSLQRVLGARKPPARRPGGFEIRRKKGSTSLKPGDLQCPHPKIRC